MDQEEQITDEPIFLDEALTNTKFGRFNYILIGISGMILAASLFETLTISFILPVICELNLTSSEKGLLSCISIFGIITSAHLWGFLADTKGRRKIILPTLFLSFTFTVLSSLAHNFTVLVILRFFTGFFISGSSATAYTYLGEFHNYKYCARAILGAAAIFCGFGILFPIIAWMTINQDWSLYIPIIDILYKPWRLFILICGLPSLLSGLALITMPESPKFLLSQGKPDRVIEILKKMYSVNTRNKKEEFTVKLIPETVEVPEGMISLVWAQTAPLFKAPHLKTTIIACILQFWIFVTCEGLFLWFPEIANRVSSYTEEHRFYHKITICEIIQSKVVVNIPETLECNQVLDASTYKITIYMQILFCIGFVFICCIVHLEKRRLIFTNLFICGIFAIFMIFVKLPNHAVYFLLVAILCGLAVPVVNSATIDLYPTKLRAMALCLTTSMGRIGSVVGTNFVATFLDTHCSTTFWISGISLIVCGILSFYIPKPKLNSTKKQENNIIVDTQL